MLPYMFKEKKKFYFANEIISCIIYTSVYCIKSPPPDCEQKINAQISIEHANVLLKTILIKRKLAIMSLNFFFFQRCFFSGPNFSLLSLFFSFIYSNINLKMDKTFPFFQNVNILQMK